jgi:hypothetical protein
MKYAGALLAISTMVLGLAGTCVADDLSDRGRGICEKNQKAIITLQMVIKNRFSAPEMGSRTDESIAETTGVVIDPSGLTVLSLSSTDPSSMFSSVISAMGEEQFKFETNLGEVKMILDDGTELAGRVVMRDKDLDLAFVKPDASPAQPLPCIDLKNAAQPQMLEPIVGLTRLPKVANRAVAAGLERIQAIIQKPRILYVPGNDPTFSSLGSPMFSLDGKIIGMVAMRSIRADSAKAGFGNVEDNLLSVIVPAGDISEAAQQALAAPAEQPEKKEPADAAPAAPADKPETPKQT